MCPCMNVSMYVCMCVLDCIFFLFKIQVSIIFIFYSGPMSIDNEPQAANNKSQCKKSVPGIHNNNNCSQFPNKESTGSLGKFFYILLRP